MNTDATVYPCTGGRAGRLQIYTFNETRKDLLGNAEPLRLDLQLLLGRGEHIHCVRFMQADGCEYLVVADEVLFPSPSPSFPLSHNQAHLRKIWLRKIWLSSRMFPRILTVCWHCLVSTSFLSEVPFTAADTQDRAEINDVTAPLNTYSPLCFPIPNAHR